MNQLGIVENEAFISEATLQDKVKIVQQEAIGAVIRNGLAEQNIKASQEQVKKWAAEIAQGWQGLEQNEKRIKIEQFSKEMYALGCSFNAYSSDEQSYMVLTGPNENFDIAIKLVTDLLNYTESNDVALKNIVSDILKSRENAMSNARAIQRQLSQYVLFGSNNPSKWILKNEELKRMNSSELLKLLKEVLSGPYDIGYYGPRNLTGSDKTSVSVLDILKSNGYAPKSLKEMKKKPVVFTEKTL